MNTADELLNDLNDEQRTAVTHGEGPLLIVAGAGTGKTTAITRRIAWLILTGKCKPEEVLALTFTEKAAGEMEERVDRLMPYGYVNLWISTFHAFCQRMLERHGIDIGIPNAFKLLDTTASWLLVRQNFERFDLRYYRPLGNPTKFIHALLQHFSRAKDEGVLPEDYLRYAKGLRLSADAESVVTSGNDEIARTNEIANAYHTYQQILLENSSLDFGDLLVYTRELFLNRTAILEQYREQFKYILVDEFQDTNWVQYQIVKLLAESKNNLTVVGDDDQSIFLFRGASYHNIIQFKKEYPNSAEVFLTRNYRSRQNILDCAYQFIQQNNPDRLEYQLAEQGGLPKELKAQNDTPGILEHLHCATLDEESMTVCEKIAALKENDPDLLWSDIAILVRANDTARPFIERLHETVIPCYVVSFKGLYAKPVVIDLLAYCTVLIRPHDSVALWRVLSFPFRTFSPGALIALSHYAHRMSVSLIEACQKADLIPALSADDRAALINLLATVERHMLLARTKSPVEVFLSAVRDSGYLGYLKDGETEEKREALALLDVLYKKIRTIAGSISDGRLKDVMEVIALEQEAGEQGSVPRKEDESPDAVRIMTVHSAKGLEFRHIFIVNMVDRRFPTTERSDAIELPQALVKETVPDGDAHLEEERRLFYVALTRAKESVYLTSSEDIGGTRKKKLSRFLEEAGVLTDISSRAERSGERDPVAFDTLGTPHCRPQAGGGWDRNDGAFPVPSVFSYSQLAAFEKCPLQYKYAFILKIPVFGKPSLSFGKTLHLTLQRFFQLILEIGSKNQHTLFNIGQKEYTDSRVSLPPPETLFSIYDECWVDEWFGGKKQKEEYRERGREILKNVYEKLMAYPPHPHALERDFTIKVGTAKERYTIKGRIDRVDELSDGTVEIIDYKTGTPKDKLAAEDKEQLLYYQIASQEVFGEKPSKLTYYYLNDGTTRSFIGSDDDLEKLKKRAAEMIARITKSDFSATPGWNCKFCDYREICEYRKY